MIISPKVFPMHCAPGGEGITEFLATLEPKNPGASKRSPNDFIDELCWKRF